MSQILQKVAPIGESRDKEILKSASSYVFAKHGESELHAHVFFPKDSEIKNKPAIAFFHGGFWETPMVTQFVPHCHHFASRGAVAIAFEYRTTSKYSTGPLEALEDAVSAITWLHENAELLGIDPTKICIGGAAGGAWLALVLTMRKIKDNPLPIRPHSLILCSALVNTSPKGQYTEKFTDKKAAKKLSPTNLLRRKLPPMLFMHGKADRITPIDEVASFRRRMKWRGNACTLIDFSGADHSFFNFNVNHSNFEHTISNADHFLVELGLLPPNLQEEI
jgi:acetyl esterase